MAFVVGAASGARIGASWFGFDFNSSFPALWEPTPFEDSGELLESKLFSFLCFFLQVLGQECNRHQRIPSLSPGLGRTTDVGYPRIID